MTGTSWRRHFDKMTWHDFDIMIYIGVLYFYSTKYLHEMQRSLSQIEECRFTLRGLLLMSLLLRKAINARGLK